MYETRPGRTQLAHPLIDRVLFRHIAQAEHLATHAGNQSIGLDHSQGIVTDGFDASQSVVARREVSSEFFGERCDVCAPGAEGLLVHCRCDKRGNATDGSERSTITQAERSRLVVVHDEHARQLSQLDHRNRCCGGHTHVAHVLQVHR